MTAPLRARVDAASGQLRLTEKAERRLDEVLTFLQELFRVGHPSAESISEEFLNRLEYLNEYGGPVSDTDPRRRFRVTLGHDFASMSFSVTWERLDLSTGEYHYAFNGGLIWHGGGNDPLCVSLTPQFWGIHT